MSALHAFSNLQHARDALVQAYLAIADLPRCPARTGLLNGIVDVQQGVQNLNVFLQATYLEGQDEDETQDDYDIEDGS